MTDKSRSGLRELQRLDDAIAEVQDRIREIDQALEEVEQPALQLDQEVGTTRGRLQEMRVEERRVELAGQEKQERLKKLEDRLGNVRNVREESAVNAELDMVRRARESDEQEALHLLDQIRRLEDRLDEQSEALEEAQAEVEPRKVELEAERAEAQAEAERLRREREAFSDSLDPAELRTYEGIRAGGRRRALSSLTEDGACGNCFSMVPPQLRIEIQHGDRLFRCEACGVILAAPLPESEREEEAATAGDTAESEAGNGAGEEAAEAGAEAGDATGDTTPEPVGEGLPEPAGGAADDTADDEETATA